MPGDERRRCRPVRAHSAGRPPKDGIYKPERLAALYGVKFERPADKSQPQEPWNDVAKGKGAVGCVCVGGERAAPHLLLLRTAPGTPALNWEQLQLPRAAHPPAPPPTHPPARRPLHAVAGALGGRALQRLRL